MSNWIAYIGNNTLVWDGVTWAVKLPFRAANLVHDTTKDIYDTFAAPFRAKTTWAGIREWFKFIPRALVWLPLDALKNIRTHLDPYMPNFVTKTIDYAHNFKEYLLMEKWKTRWAWLKKFWTGVKWKWSNKSKPSKEKDPTPVE